MANIDFTKAVARKDLCVAATILNNVRYDGDNIITQFPYNDAYRVEISGGEGVDGVSSLGEVTAEVENITGRGTISFLPALASWQFEFLSPGIVWVKFQMDSTTSGDKIYQSSKVLVLELTLHQRQVTVKVVSKTEGALDFNIGTALPSEEDICSRADTKILDLQKVDDVYDTMASKGEIYFVYNSPDFYREDFANYFNNSTMTVKGVHYAANGDGSWTVTGATGPNYDDRSTYDLIVSTQGLPSYFQNNHRIRVWRDSISSGDNKVKLHIETYKQGKQYASVTVTSDNHERNPVEFNVNRNSGVDGIRVYYKVESNKTFENAETFTYHMVDLSDRQVDINRPGEYPVAARNAKVPVTEQNGYNPTIQYRSTMLRYQNLKDYYVYTEITGSDGVPYTSASDMGRLSVQHLRAKPYSEVIVTVTALTGNYFCDAWMGEGSTYNWGDYYIVGNHDGDHQEQQNEWNSMWETGSKITVGDSNGQGLRIMCFPLHNDVPYQRVEGTAVYDKNGRLRQCSYRFFMPVADAYVQVRLKSLASEDTPIWGRYPYTDIGWSDDSGSYTVEFTESKYKDALMFCYYARQQHFGENEDPLMSGTGGSSFYTHESNKIKTRYLTRRDMVTVVSRISHIPKYTKDPGRSSRDYPDAWFLNHAFSINAPLDKIYGYAGYPPVPDRDPATGAETEPYVHLTNVWTTFANPSRALATAYWMPNETGSNDDYLVNSRYLPSIGWGTWVGVTNGITDMMFGPNNFVTFEQAATVLWRYAKFRQLDVPVHSYTYDESTASSWAQGGPLQWVIGAGISDGYHMKTTSETSSRRMEPQDYLDRAEFAYMVYRFCQLYAW